MVTVWRRLVSLVTVATLTGVPALLAACVALCLPVTAASGVDGGHATGASHAHHEMSASAAGIAHDHHAMAAASAADAPAHDHSAGDIPAALQLSSAPHDCCPDGQAFTSRAVAAGRQDAQALSAIVDPYDPSLAVWLPAPRVAARGPAVSPPSPPGTSPVLRI